MPGAWRKSVCERNIEQSYDTAREGEWSGGQAERQVLGEEMSMYVSVSNDMNDVEAEND